MIVKIDNRENARHCEAVKFYRERYKIIIEEMPIGDFIFSDNKTEVVFEYKTFKDFQRSVNEGRVFDQAIRQCKNFRYHFVVVELDSKMNNLYGIPKYCEAIASLNTFTTVIICSNFKLALKIMEKQAEFCLEKHPLTKRPSEKLDNVACNYLMLVNGVDKIKAHSICKHLGLRTFEDLKRVTTKQLTKVPGIGPITAQKITASIQLND